MEINEIIDCNTGTNYAVINTDGLISKVKKKIRSLLNCLLDAAHIGNDDVVSLNYTINYTNLGCVKLHYIY